MGWGEVDTKKKWRAFCLGRYPVYWVGWGWAGGGGFGRQLAHTPEPQGKIRRDGMWTPCRQTHSDVGTLFLNHGAMPQDSKTSAVIRFEVGGGWGGWEGATLA